MSDLLSLGASGIRAYSGALQTVGDNIANAQTPGYARRGIRLTEATPAADAFPYRSQLNPGGATVAGVTRSSDRWLVEDARSAGSDAARASARLGWLEATERTLDDGGAGVGRSLTALYNRADELAADPSSSARRTAFLQSADDLATSFRRTSDSLSATASGIGDAAAGSVASFNTDVAALARVNDGLRRAREGSTNQASLIDERDRLLDPISATMPVGVAYGPKGDAVLTLPGGETLLSGSTRAILSVAVVPGGVGFALDGTNVVPSGGTLAGLADAAIHLAGQQTALDTLAASAASQFNIQHLAGRDAAGQQGLVLFTGTIAATLTAAALTADKVAAADASSANGNALAFGTLRANGGEASWASLVAAQAQATASARAQDSAAATRHEGATVARDALSGVDLDREAGELIRYQQAYEAAVRVLQVARDTMQSILDARPVIATRTTQEIGRQSRLAQDIARLQTQVSTGRRIQSASDDPVASARVAQIATEQANDTSWAANLTLASALATQADGVLASLSERMIHAHGLMVAAANGTLTTEDRATYAKELRSIAGDVAGLRATRTSLDTPLFATGAPGSMRVDGSLIIAPVASASDAFESGGVALTTMLTDAAGALDSGNTAAIATALGSLQSAIGHTADAAADQGVRAARIDTMSERIATRAVGLSDERSGLEDTDLSVAISELNMRQITLEAAQAAFARINRRTLFDLIG